MAVMTLLLGAEDAGLGALFFGVFEREAELRDALGIPDRSRSCSEPSPSATPSTTRVARGGSASRRRRSAGEIIHRGGW